MPSKTTASGAGAEHCRDCGSTLPDDARFCPSCGTARGGEDPPAYCSNCGTGFGPDDAFCSACGEPRSADGDAQPAAGGARGQTGPTDVGGDRDADREYDTFRRRVTQYVEAGWEIRRDDGDRVEVVDRGIGSIPIHVLLLLLTGGFGNLLYGWYHYSILAETRYLSMDDPDPTPSARIESTGRAAGETSAVETVTTYLLSGLLLLIGAWFLSLGLGGAAVGTGAALAVGLGLGLFLVGVGVAPPVEKRLERRHDPRKFGRLRTVDHRVLRPSEPVEEPCVVCGESFRGGLLRRRRDETVVAGVPIRTHSMRHNHYCADCARSELFDEDGMVGFGDEAVDELKRSDDEENGGVSDDEDERHGDDVRRGDDERHDDGEVDMATDEGAETGADDDVAFEWSTPRSKSENTRRE